MEIKDSGKFRAADFEKVIKDNFIEQTDHKNLNIDVANFKDKIATIENIAEFAWGKLAGKFENCRLVSVKIWESEKTCCEYKQD